MKAGAPVLIEDIDRWTRRRFSSNATRDQCRSQCAKREENNQRRISKQELNSWSTMVSRCCATRLPARGFSKVQQFLVSRRLRGFSKAAAVAPIEKLVFRVGLIGHAWHHPDSDTLWCEEVYVGDEDEAPRTIASGLRAHYDDPELLIGRPVVVATNLKPRNIAGFLSRGMILCASRDDKVEFIEPPPGSQVGERITFDSIVFDDDRVPEDELSGNQSTKCWKAVADLLTTDADCVARYDGSAFVTSAGVVRAKTLADAVVS
jgi:methionine--tRNA ligase beta chain